MATSATPLTRAAHNVEVPYLRFVPNALPRTTATDSVEETDRAGAARGVLVGLLLCAPFWLGVYLILF